MPRRPAAPSVPRGSDGEAPHFKQLGEKGLASRWEKPDVSFTAGNNQSAAEAGALRSALLCSVLGSLISLSLSPRPPKPRWPHPNFSGRTKAGEPLEFGVAPQTRLLPFPARMHPPRCPPKLSKQPQVAFTRGGVLDVHPLPKIGGVPAGRSILYFGGTLRRLGQRLGDPLQSPTYLSGSLRRPARFRVRQSRPLAGAEPPFGPPDGASARPPVPLESAGS